MHGVVGGGGWGRGAEEEAEVVLEVGEVEVEAEVVLEVGGGSRDGSRGGVGGLGEWKGRQRWWWRFERVEVETEGGE